MINKIFEAGNLIPERTRYQVLACLVEETGELAQEVKIAERDSYKLEGIDGILGEAVDVIICAVDLIRGSYPTITEAEIIEVVNKKLNKWVNKTASPAQIQQWEKSGKR